MQKQTTQLTSKQWEDQMLREHYEKARQAKAEGRLVCWSTSIAPQELLTTMDIVTMYPENHAAAIGARHVPPSSANIILSYAFIFFSCTACKTW